jgi:hypothetical protein
VIEEEWLEKLGKEKKLENEHEQENEIKRISLDLVLYVYRRLRENYEFKLKFDEAGKFFIKEMELKRKYREAPSLSAVFKRKLIKLLKKLKLVNANVQEPKIEYVLKQNGRLTRHFSLTGLYYHLSTYGESIVKPTIIGAITVTLATLFWLMQSKPTLEPHFFVNSSSSLYNSTSHFVYLNQAGNFTHWLTAFQRSLADFLPLLSLPGDIKVGAIDYVIKIVGGALTFGLLLIALRRKFERKYTR